MRLELFQLEKHGIQIRNYQLADATYTGQPADVIEFCQTDSERYPLVILNELEQLVGFFCLHLGAGPETYDFLREEAVLLRAFSIDERFRKLGYAKASLDLLPSWIDQHLPGNIRKVVLAVNAKNISAQKTYEKAGFVKNSRTAQGRLGLLYLYEKNLI